MLPPMYLAPGSLAETGTESDPHVRSDSDTAVRVLIAEDDARTRALLERGLREELFRVETAGDATSAEAHAIEGVFDAIVLDVQLPDHDGFIVCRRLRSRGIDTPILLLTGRGGVKDRVRGLDAGADDYLAKPFAFEELVARLRAVTRRGRTRQLETVLSYGPSCSIRASAPSRSTACRCSPLTPSSACSSA